MCFPDKRTYPVIGIDGDSGQGNEECSPQNVPHCSPLPQKPGNERQQGIVPETETILPSRLFLLTTSVGFPHSLPILSKRAGFKGLLVGEKETCYNTFSYQYPAGGGSLPRWKGIRWTWRISDKSGISCGNTAPLREQERSSEPPGVLPPSGTLSRTSTTGSSTTERRTALSSTVWTPYSSSGASRMRSGAVSRGL